MPSADLRGKVRPGKGNYRHRFFFRPSFCSMEHGWLAVEKRMECPAGFGDRCGRQVGEAKPGQQQFGSQ